MGKNVRIEEKQKRNDLMSEKLCKKCQAPLEDENLEICANCAASEPEEITEEVMENEAVVNEETAMENEEAAYIDYEVVEEEPVKQSSGSVVLKILSAVFAVLSAIYPVIYFIQSSKDFSEQIKAAKEQYEAMGMPFEIPQGLLPAQYLVFSVYLLIAAVAIIGAVLVFSKKTSIASVVLLSFGACWGVTTGIPNLCATLLMFQEGQEPITAADPIVLISISGILCLAAAILAAVSACKSANAVAVTAVDDEVVIDPLAFDDGEVVEVEDSLEEVSEEEVIEVVNNEE